MERHIEVRRLRGETRAVHARASLARWDRSGLSAAAFARCEGVNPVTLKRWRQEFDPPGGATPGAGEFIELEVGSGGRARGLEVVLPDGRAVRVPPGFDEQELHRLLAVLERVRC